jgi:hypothetical protein
MGALTGTIGLCKSCNIRGRPSLFEQIDGLVLLFREGRRIKDEELSLNSHSHPIDFQEADREHIIMLMAFQSDRDDNV